VEPGHINFFIVLQNLGDTISIHIRDHADSLKCVLQNERLDITSLSLFIYLIIDLFDGSSTDSVCHNVAPLRLIISRQHLLGALLVLSSLAKSIIAFEGIVECFSVLVLMASLLNRSFKHRHEVIFLDIVLVFEIVVPHQEQVNLSLADLSS
jgi:hypothetical protein